MDFLEAYKGWELWQECMWTIVGAYRQYQELQGVWDAAAVRAFVRDVGLHRGFGEAPTARS